MSQQVEFLGTTRTVPETDETDWGDEVTAQLVDLLSTGNLVFFRVGSQVGLRFLAESSSLAAGATLTPTKVIHKVSGNGGAVTLSAVTAIADGVADGQELRLIGSHAANTVTIQHGANVQLNGDCVLGEHDVLALRWDAGVGDWIELWRNN